MDTNERCSGNAT